MTWHAHARVPRQGRPPAAWRRVRGSLLLGAAAMTGHAAHAQTAADAPPAASQVPPAAAAAGGAPAAGAAGSGDIIVQARYRNERLQDVPIAITALSADRVAANPALVNLKQLQQFLPGVQILGYGVRNVSLAIRGLGSNAGTAAEGLDQGVGLYIDGVYRARGGEAVTEILDVDSIQVLRGPQGTLFGKNTVAGAIEVRTRPPSFDPEARVDATFGSYGYVRGQATVSGPLSDTLALRLSGSRVERTGTVYNVRYDQRWDDRHTYNVKADLLFKPTDGISARLIGDYEMIYGHPGLNTIAAILPATLANGTRVRDFYTRAAQIGYVPLAVSRYGRITDIDGRQDSKLKTGGVSLDLEAPLGPLTLTSITAYRFWNFYPHYDADQFGADIYSYGATAPHQKQFSQELRVSSNGHGALQYTGGLYYFWQRSVNTTRAVFGKDAAKWLVSPTAPDALAQGLEGYSVGIPITHSYAAFGQATWTFAPGWSVTGGLRYTYEKKYGSYHAERRGNAVPISALPLAFQATAPAIRNSFAPASGDYAASRSNGNVSGTVGLRHEFTDRVSAYATYSRGYKSAGVNLIQPAPGQDVFLKPETVDAYEVGLKSQVFDRRLTVNAALFWTEDANYQASIYDFQNRQFFYSNAGKVRTRGVELDMQARPLPILDLFASGAYTDGTYLSYKAALCPYLLSYQPTCNISGQRLAGVSKWAGSLGGELHVPVRPDVVGYLNANVSYRSSYYSAVNDDPETLVRGYALVDARVGARIGESRWDVSVFVSNLLNKKYFNTLSVSNSLGTAIGVLGDPRIYGLNLKARF